MARIVPSDTLPPQAGGHGASPEMRTLARLRDGLDDTYTIYHGVHWARASAQGSVYGEIDFIVANRSAGCSRSSRRTRRSSRPAATSSPATGRVAPAAGPRPRRATRASSRRSPAT